MFEMKLVAAAIATVGAVASVVASKAIIKNHNKQSYDKEGYNKEGYDKYGYNKEGYDKNGYNKRGYDAYGYDKEGYYEDGYNKEGYDKYGYNKRGYDAYGYDKEGYDEYGYNIEGYDKNGYDFSGNTKEYYIYKYNEMVDLLKKAKQQMNQNEFSYALHDIRIGLEKGIKCIILHLDGKDASSETLDKNICYCKNNELIDKEFCELLFSAKNICNSLQHDSNCEKNYNDVYFSYKILEKLANMVKNMQRLSFYFK